MMVLWLLILRGIAVEFRGHLAGAVWSPFWDVTFSVASTLLAVFYGAALGNVVRGVPLDAAGEFFLPLWTNFRTGAEPGILDWYTVLSGVAALAVLTVHGAVWVRSAGARKLSPGQCGRRRWRSWRCSPWRVSRFNRCSAMLSRRGRGATYSRASRCSASREFA